MHTGGVWQPLTWVSACFAARTGVAAGGRPHRLLVMEMEAVATMQEFAPKQEK